MATKASKMAQSLLATGQTVDFVDVCRVVGKAKSTSSKTFNPNRQINLSAEEVSNRLGMQETELEAMLGEDYVPPVTAEERQNLIEGIEAPAPKPASMPQPDQPDAAKKAKSGKPKCKAPRCRYNADEGSLYCKKHKYLEKELDESTLGNTLDERGFSIKDRAIFEEVQQAIDEIRGSMPQNWDPTFLPRGGRIEFYAKGQTQTIPQTEFLAHRTDLQWLWDYATAPADAAKVLSAKLNKVAGIPRECEIPGCIEPKLDNRSYQMVKRALSGEVVMPTQKKGRHRRDKEAEFATAHLRCRVTADRIGKVIVDNLEKSDDELVAAVEEHLLDDKAIARMLRNVHEREPEVTEEFFLRNLKAIFMATFKAVQASPQ